MSRVAAATPESARPVAWLHEIFEWTSVSEEKLLAYGASDDELRALRLLTRTLGRDSESGYLAHITMIARANGPAGVLARTVKASDLEDRLRHPGPGTGGSRPPYERALRLILAAEAAQRAGAGWRGVARRLTEWRGRAVWALVAEDQDRLRNARSAAAKRFRACASAALRSHASPP